MLLLLLLSLLGLLCAPAALAQDSSELAKLLASDAGVADQFGSSVSISGDAALVGARQDDDPDSNSGSAYVFRDDGKSWSQEDKLSPSGGAEGDECGFMVAVSGDVAVVGCRLADDLGSNSGSAYVFRFDGLDWLEEQKLTASDGAVDDGFGIFVAVDGSTIAVGATGDDDGGSGSGSAYMFRFDGQSWLEEQKLTASDGAASDRFGDVAISGDAVLVGAFGDANERGSAYVFRFDGQSWLEEQKLTASDGTAGDRFGTVAISGDVGVIGAPADDDGGGSSGSAYAFRFDGQTWNEEEKLTASDAEAQDNFGSSAAVDGDTAVIAAVLEDENGSNAGAAYVFRYDGRGWNEEKLLASEGGANDTFGSSVAIEGETAVVGARFDDRGSAYVFSVPVPEPGMVGMQASAIAAIGCIAARVRRRAGELACPNLPS